MITKRYVGRLVHSMDKHLYIALVGLLSDDPVSASLFVGNCYFGNLLQTEDCPDLNNWGDVQRFERQGYAAMHFNLRV